MIEAVGLLLHVGVIVLAAAALLRALSGCGRLAWTITGVATLAMPCIIVLENAINRGEGQSGFALVLILVLFLAPLLAGSFPGCLAGQLVLRSRRRGRRV